MGSTTSQHGRNQQGIVLQQSSSGNLPVCTGNRPPNDGDFEERSAMILGLNPKALRVSRPWRVYLWRSRHHWAIVVQPEGDSFRARLVDDVLRNPTYARSIEVASGQCFLVFELLTYRGDNLKEEFYLQIGAKPDFETWQKDVTNLGRVGPLDYHQLTNKATSVIQQYRRYGFIGCNCQHFAVEFAQALGVERNLKTEDDVAASNLTEGGIGMATAGMATAGTVGVAAAASVTTGSASAPIVLGLFASGAGVVGIVGAVIVIAASGGYEELKASHRRPATPSNKDQEPKAEPEAVLVEAPPAAVYV